MQTYSIKTENNGNLVAISDFIRVIDDDTGKEIFPTSLKLKTDRGEFVRIVMEFPVSEIDLKGILPDFIPCIKNTIECYKQFNKKRTDGLIYHTDCLCDFVEFLERGMK